MAADGVTRAACFVTSAYSSWSSCRQYRENLYAAADGVSGAPRLDRLRHYFNHPGFVEPVVDAVLAALADLPDGVRDGARLVFVTHSIPTSMNDASGPDGGAYLAQHQDVAAVVADRVRQATGVARGHDLVFCSRSGAAARAVAGAGRQRPPRGARGGGEAAVVLVPVGFVSDHMEVVYDLDTEALATAERLGLAVRRAATAGHRPAVRRDGPRPAARARRGRARRGARPARRWARSVRAGTAARRAAAPTRAARCPRSAASDVTDARRELADLALDAARAAAELVRERGASRGSSVADTKTSDVDVVTEADRAAETLIRDRIRAARPDDAFLGEEGDDGAGHDRRALDRRPDRRHRELPLRPAAVRRVDRRRGRRRGGGRRRDRRGQARGVRRPRPAPTACVGAARRRPDRGARPGAARASG